MKEKIANGFIIFLLILPMSFFFPYIYHYFFSLLSINHWFLEKTTAVATMVFFMTLLMPHIMSLKARMT